jgi:hypothetical protein
LIPDSIASRIRHAGQIRAYVDRVCGQEGDHKCHQQTFWKSLLEVTGQALPGHLADAGAHHLHRGH